MKTDFEGKPRAYVALAAAISLVVVIAILLCTACAGEVSDVWSAYLGRPDSAFSSWINLQENFALQPELTEGAAQEGAETPDPRMKRLADCVTFLLPLAALLMLLFFSTVDNKSFYIYNPVFDRVRMNA